MYHHHSVVYSPLYWECAWPQFPSRRGVIYRTFLQSPLPLCSQTSISVTTFDSPRAYSWSHHLTQLCGEKVAIPELGRMMQEACLGYQEPGYFHPGLKSVKFTFCVLGSRYILWHSGWAMLQIERQQTHTLFWEKIICLYPILLPLTNHGKLWQTSLVEDRVPCCDTKLCFLLHWGRMLVHHEW